MTTRVAPAKRRLSAIVVVAAACREVGIILMFPLFPLLQRDYRRAFSIFVC
jgi:hypothetical protein